MKKKIIGILIILTLLGTTIISANANVDNDEIENMNINYISTHKNYNQQVIMLQSVIF